MKQVDEKLYPTEHVGLTRYTKMFSDTHDEPENDKIVERLTA